jgi:hypothetical protein
MALSNNAQIILVAGAIGIAAWLVWRDMPESDADRTARQQRLEREAAESYARSATSMCLRFVRASLKAPTTASFPPDIEPITVAHADGTVTVGGVVDAQNSFGAMLRNAWACTVRRTSIGPDGTQYWDLTVPVELR